MVETFLGAVDYQELINQAGVVVGNVFQLEVVAVIFLEILYTFKGDLNVFRGGGSALGGKGGNGSALVDLGDSFDGEGPVYFLADHDQYFALVHFAGVGNEGEGDFQSAEGFDVEFGFGGVQQPEDLFILFAGVYHFDPYCDVVLEGVSELDGVGVFFHESVEDGVVGEGDRGQTHSAQLVLPIPHFL